MFKTTFFIALLTTSAWVSVAAAQSTGGAPSDISSATVSPKSVKQADKALAVNVRRALAKTKNLDMTHILVRSRSGAITLTGSVPTSEQITQAGDVTGQLNGVKSVDNRLEIGMRGH